MRTGLSFALCAALLLAAPAGAFAGKEAEEKKPEVKEATDKEAKHELTIFEREFDTADIDFKLEAVKRLGKCVHKDVVEVLMKLLLKDPDVNVRVAAARGLGNQQPFAKDVGRTAMRLLEDKDLDPKLLAVLVQTLGKLDYKKAWEPIYDLVAHENDDVVIAVFRVAKDWKDLRICQELQEFWDMYPSEGTFATGTVNVDTGTAGNADAKAAKAKWQAKYGNKAKQRPRPECVKVLKELVAVLTADEKIDTAQKFREWRGDHKAEIKAAENARD